MGFHYLYLSVSLTLKNLKCTNVEIALTTHVHSGLYENKVSQVVPSHVMKAYGGAEV